jgi:hypothetical protein
MVLVCNDPTNADVVLDGLAARTTGPVAIARLAHLHKPAPAASRAALGQLPRYQSAKQGLALAGLIASN